MVCYSTCQFRSVTMYRNIVKTLLNTICGSVYPKLQQLLLICFKLIGTFSVNSLLCGRSLHCKVNSLKYRIKIFETLLHFHYILHLKVTKM
jgi:hypothetical protein